MPRPSDIEGELHGKRIAWGFGGGIAAYKACHAMRLFVHAGAEVRAAMTTAATHFVGPLTVQALSGGPVLTDVLEPGQEALYGHLDVARGADLVVLAPATANLIAKVANGMASCAVSTVVAAARAPVLVAPAMNVAMWENPAVQRNVRLLEDYGVFSFVGPASGLLADGDEGMGRLEEPEAILEAAVALLTPKDWEGRRVVITSGPTREHLDPVRFLSNPSTGRMGHALARAAARRGAEVVLLSGPTELPSPAGVRTVRITSADELLEAALKEVEGADAFFAAAAVADQRPDRRAPHKVKKEEGVEHLTLVRTPDVLATVSKTVRGWARPPLLVGFAAETQDVVDNAQAKRVAKGLDLVVANRVGGPVGGFASELNEVVLVAADGAEPLPLLPKGRVAHRILDRAGALLGGGR